MCSPHWASATGLNAKPVGVSRNSCVRHAVIAPCRFARDNKFSPPPTRYPGTSATLSPKPPPRTLRTNLAEVGTDALAPTSGARSMPRTSDSVAIWPLHLDMERGEGYRRTAANGQRWVHSCSAAPRQEGLSRQSCSYPTICGRGAKTYRVLESGVSIAVR